MSVLVERSMVDLNKERIPIYPLFQKGAVAQPQLKKTTSQDDIKTSNDQALPANIPKDPRGRKSQKLKTSKSTQSTQLPIPDAPSAGIRKSTEHGELLEVDPNNGRRKRRKTSSTEGVTPKESGTTTQELSGTNSLDGGVAGLDSDTAASDGMTTAWPSLDSTSIEQEIIIGVEGGVPLPEGLTFAGNPPLPAHDDAGYSNVPVSQNDHAPRKVLRFNPKTGTIGSPPAKKSQPPVPSNSKKATSSRGKLKSKLVTIRYGQGQVLPSSIGQKIDQILNDTKPVTPMEEIKPQKAVEVKCNRPEPAKSTHPFFLGKASTISQSPQKAAKQDVTVIDLTQSKERTPQARAQPSSRGEPGPPQKATIPFSGFGSSTKITKFPGAVEPAWPCRGMVHIRGLNIGSDKLQDPSSVSPSLIPQSKKSKYQAVRISEGEDILENLIKDLCITNVVDSIRDINPDEFPPVPDCLRIPTKHLVSGFDIQKRIRKELHTRLPFLKAVVQSSSEDEIQQNHKSRPHIHPAILKTYNSISTSLSAFDRGLCESHAWIHKYSPKLASEVLQSEREISILKSWLQSLTVKAVEAGLGSVTGASRKPGPKRKRKSRKSDGFVISSDEEADDMDEISEPEDDALFQNPGPRRTEVRFGDLTKDSGRSTNAVVISGPHGCGKTAAVYAVAKELGFEVFEINPGSKRTGKDILDKVGDMARNHQVQRVLGPAQLDGAAEEDRRRIDEALADDLTTGRQGRMDSFFKTQPVAKPKAKTRPAPVSKSGTKEFQSSLEASKPKSTAKTQKQSLILIEEADILYKEDTQFWTTIMELIETSRRPIIITCNDETALPKLQLHAIIRMNAPSINLAVDYMLVVAACEGHVLQRDAVQTLYEGRNMDLRASLTELDFWCQFAIGDQKNGLGWYFPRWPKGSDIDKDGHILRVVSEGTYKAGMGWLSQDIFESNMHHLDIEEETLHEACDAWRLDVGNWQDCLNMDSWAKEVRDRPCDKAASRTALQAYNEFLDTMSSADLCSGGLFATNSQHPIDASMPDITAKVRDDYTQAAKLLEASTVVSYDTLGKDMSLWMKSRSRSYLHLDQHVKMGMEVPRQLRRPDEADIIRLIRKEATIPDPSLIRQDFSAAFDPISEPEKSSYNPVQLEASVFDRTMKIIVEDMAPYVRSIVDFDARLQTERTKLSNLISEGGRKGKRMRTTRSAMSALEGGARSTTRREKYFGKLLNPYLVMKTGMQSWMDAALVQLNAGSRRSSRGSLEESKTESERDELVDDQ